MAQEETRKKKTGMARCLELASQHKGLVFISGILAAAAAVCSFLPYLSIYFIMRELIGVFPDMANANMSVVLRYGWMALGGIAGNVILYFCALMCSHLAAFGTLYELKLAFANHITEIPLGYHLTIGSGRMRKIMDENIESIEKFIAHQFPDFVASLVAPLALVILLLAIDWRYGIVSLFGIILAFVVQFLGFNGSAKEKMHHYQTAQEDMNNASVEYVRGMPEIKAFNQTADSFRRLSKSITDYTSFVLEYAMGWQNCMPGFTTIIHNIYLLLIPVGIFIGMGAEDYRTYSLTFIFYLVLAPAISGVLNKIMYISESFTQIDGNVERMEEVLSIPVLQNQDVGAREQGHMAAAKAAYCDEFVMRLSDGYQTVLGENGSTLSGGERQRISIARALLKDAPIILLDEATASLDPENEVLIQRAIARLVEGKTVIMIAHRLRTVVDADQIFVLENGKLVERGTHDELIAHKGLYEKLYHIQQESLDWVV